MACDRPAVVAIEAIEGIEENVQALANDVHWRGASGTVEQARRTHSIELRSSAGLKSSSILPMDK
jgi:hypothetical protein